jgi:uncharacterized protein (TIGR02646 family)
MIHIDRSTKAAPEILVKETKRGPKETKRAIAYYSVPNPDDLKAFRFSAYSDRTVKDALIELFRGKCAYCESLFLHVYSGDVEHFRPKGAISGVNTEKPGYYWLAANWENLLLSCRNCNQKLKHLTYGESVKKTMGKMNQFPLSDETKRARFHVDAIFLEDKVRLIINPCTENPEKYFKYHVRTGVIKAKSTSKKKKVMANTSIDVYVLQRVPLVQARERKSIEIKAQMQRIKESLKNVSKHIDSNDNAIKLYYNRILRKELKKLNGFLSPNAEYLGLARQMIFEFLKKNFGIEN